MPNPIRSLELAARRKDAEDAKNFREALEEIANPLPFIEARARGEGYVLNGSAVIEILNSRNTYQDIARNALKASKGGAA